MAPVAKDHHHSVLQQWVDHSGEAQLGKSPGTEKSESNGDGFIIRVPLAA